MFTDTVKKLVSYNIHDGPGGGEMGPSVTEAGLVNGVTLSEGKHNNTTQQDSGRGVAGSPAVFSPRNLPSEMMWHRQKGPFLSCDTVPCNVTHHRAWKNPPTS